MSFGSYSYEVDEGGATISSGDEYREVLELFETDRASLTTEQLSRLVLTSIDALEDLDFAKRALDDKNWPEARNEAQKLDMHEFV